MHVTLAPGARVEQPVPRGWTATAYVFGGTGHIGAREVRRGDYAVFADDGDTIALENTGREPLDALLLSATPIDEPMVRYGPFVMNSVDEIQRAFEDFRAGRFGDDQTARRRVAQRVSSSRRRPFEERIDVVCGRRPAAASISVRVHARNASRSTRPCCAFATATA